MDLGQIMLTRRRVQSEEGAERGQETHRPTVGPVRTSLCLHSHLLPSSNDRVTRNPKAELGASLSPHGCNRGIHTQHKGSVFLTKYSFGNQNCESGARKGILKPMQISHSTQKLSSI